MSNPSAKTKRKYPRVKPERGHPIRIDINGLDFMDIVLGNDISEGGLNFEVPHQFSGCDMDQPVSLIISLPHPVGRILTVNAKIRHISEKVFGVAFKGLTRRHRRRIRKYMAYRMKDQPLLTRWKFRLGNMLRLGM